MIPDEAALERLRAYAAIENGAADKAQQESLARAADLVALYESMTWVPEMDEHHPVGRRQFGSGPQHDPQSFARFTRWLTQVRGVPVQSAHTYRLKAAHDLLAEFGFSLGEMKPRTERELRPFLRLKKQGYGDRIPDIWAQVVADGDWTARTVTEKIAEFRKGWTVGEKRKASAAERRSAAKSRIKSAVESAYAVSPRATAEAILEVLEAHPDMWNVVAQIVDREMSA